MTSNTRERKRDFFMKAKQTFYTLKLFKIEDNALLENGASDKVLFKHRKIWSLASKNWAMKRVSYKRLEQAKALYNAIKKAWRLKDLYLEADSNEYTQKRACYYSKKEDEQLDKIKRLCKPLDLVLSCSTFAHVYTTDKASKKLLCEVM